MVIWFWSAVAGAVFAGISNFFFKVAAHRGYNAEVFTLYGGLASILFTGIVGLLYHSQLLQWNWYTAIMVCAGMIAGLGGIGKVNALRHIDSTIFFPLFKLLSPALAIVAGILFFDEAFTFAEWTGMFFGLTMPLLLITKAENGRQNNLIAGLVLVAFVAATSAIAAALNKFVIDTGLDVVVGLFFASVGVFVGTLCTIAYKKGVWSLIRHVREDTDFGIVLFASCRAVFICISLGFILYAYSQNGTLAIVQTIHSMYILIPVVLSVIYFQEHWNWQKAVAVTLSVLALALLR